MRRTLGIIIGIAILAGCLCLPAATFTWLRLDRAQQTDPTAILTPSATPAGTTTSSATAELLAGVSVPPRDSRVLAARLKGLAAIPEIVNAEAPAHTVGQQARFWVSNSDTMEVFSITATLRATSEYAEFWVQNDVSFDERELQKAAKTFDEQIYPAVQKHFGSEWSPGVDNNPRIVVLNARFSGAAGYFSSQDEFSHQINPYSNEREMIYLSIDAAPPGSGYYEATLAHEFQHMVHWHMDSNEDGWVNEGASELASRLAGFGVAGSASSYARKPDTQLNAWALSPDANTLPHYGASYLWFEYFLQRLGAEAVKSLVTEQANGIAGFEKVLSAMPEAPGFDELYADWVVANLLDDTTLLDGRYGLEEVDLRVMMEATERKLPAQGNGTVNQYGTDYIALTPRSGPLQIEVWGNPTVPVVPNSPIQGRYEWWSNRGDMSNTTLTRAFDLTGLTKATLQYSLWYELEDGWDYAYVEVSTDNGETWQLLETPNTTDYNPNGNAFGPGYTGYSGHPAGSTTRLEPSWIHETVDLTPFAGKNVLVRFEMITDDAVNLPGLCLDEIRVPELGFADDAETASAGWEAEGFVRMDNILPQQLLVQVIEKGRETRVHRLHLTGGERGTIVLDRFGEGSNQAVLAISGLTRHTTETAQYNYSITEAPKTP